MILDITFFYTEPKQYQQVRKTTMWPNNGRPEMVIHFYDSVSRYEVNIPLKDIRTITITND